METVKTVFAAFTPYRLPTFFTARFPDIPHLSGAGPANSSFCHLAAKGTSVGIEKIQYLLPRFFQHFLHFCLLAKFTDPL